MFAQLKSTQIETLTGKVRLLGRITDTQEEICLAEFTPALVSDDASTLARLAANQRYWQLRKGSKNKAAAATEKLRALAERYQLVTDDTSLILVKQREAHELAQEMPRLKAVNSMLAAGWGGHGSVEDSQVMFSIAVPDLRFCADSLSPVVGSGAAAGFGRALQSKSTPRLAKHGSSLSKNPRDFFDDFDDDVAFGGETPRHGKDSPKNTSREPEFWNNGDAYSRDQATWCNYEGLTPAGFMEWLRLNPQLPLRNYVDLREAHLPRVVVEWLEFILGQDQPEEVVVTALAEVMAGLDITVSQAGDAVLGPVDDICVADQDALRQRLLDALAGINPLRWPDCIVDFAEPEQALR